MLSLDQANSPSGYVVYRLSLSIVQTVSKSKGIDGIAKAFI